MPDKKAKTHYQLVELLNQTWECYPAAKPLTDAGHAMYREALRGWPLKSIRAALLDWLRQEDRAWPPTPGQVLAIASRRHAPYNPQLQEHERAKALLEQMSAGNRDVNRVHKRLPGNQNIRHRLQDVTGQPIPRKLTKIDEVLEGSDDQRFVLRSEIE